MNANEVIAALAGESVHPNDHVNMGQSSNDVFPSAVHLAALDGSVNELLLALEQLRRGARAQGSRVRRRRQVGPHAFDGRGPGDASPGVRRVHRPGLARRSASATPCRASARSCSGGTATGTGLNTHPDFAERVRALLHEDTGPLISGPADPFEAQAARDGLVELSGALKVVAVSLTKVANDLRFMGSGPRAGLAEIFLPELQKARRSCRQGQPGDPRGRDAGRGAGDRQRHCDHRRRPARPLRAKRLRAAPGAESPAVDRPARQRVAAARREVRRRDRGQPRAMRAVRGAHALGRNRAQSVHRLRQGDRDRQDGSRDRSLAARGRPRSRRGGQRPTRRLSDHAMAKPHG